MRAIAATLNEHQLTTRMCASIVAPQHGKDAHRYMANIDIKAAKAYAYHHQAARMNINSVGGGGGGRNNGIINLNHLLALSITIC